MGIKLRLVGVSLLVGLGVLVILSLILPILPIYWRIVCLKAPCQPIFRWSDLLEVINRFDWVDRASWGWLLGEWLIVGTVVYLVGIQVFKRRNE